jgi:cysteine desulfurase/selenocysteine lyase
VSPLHALNADALDVEAIRSHFDFPRTGRIVTNNAASTQPPRELLQLHHALALHYENVHRGQSSASMQTTRLFEAAYDDIARFVGAPSCRSIVVVRNTTEAHNAVMYSLMAELRDGDNVVTMTLEHNSNFVPWFAMCHDILPKFGRRVELRLARFDPSSGALDMAHLASLIDARTKLVCCTAASNFLGSKPPLAEVRAISAASGYTQPSGARRSYLLIDGAQWVPGNLVDFEALGTDYLSCSFHKMLAPFGHRPAGGARVGA